MRRNGVNIPRTLLLRPCLTGLIIILLHFIDISRKNGGTACSLSTSHGDYRTLVVASYQIRAHTRSAVLSAFADNPLFDAYLHPYIHNSRQQHHLSEMLGLGSLDNLRCLFIALNDESLTVRRAAMCTLGRLARRELGSTNDSGVSGVKTDNGQGIVWPQLRATLLELLVSLESAAARLYGGSAFGGSGSGMGQVQVISMPIKAISRRM